MQNVEVQVLSVAPMLIYAVISQALESIIALAIYVAIIVAVLVGIGVFGTRQDWHTATHRRFKVAVLWVSLAVVAGVTFVFAAWPSGDYQEFVVVWLRAYAGVDWVTAVRQITTVSNYTPLYNYFLIAVAQILPADCWLYAVKLLSFAFSILLAFAMEKLIAHVRQERFAAWRFALFLVLPPLLLEYAWWGQCDAIYLAFCLLAFWCALTHRSKTCMVLIGLAFANKLQFLFIVPILFVMLIIKDADGKAYLRWRDLWLAPLPYLLNLLPVLCGASLVDLLLVYCKQGTYYELLSKGCPNFLYFLALQDQVMPADVVQLLGWLFTGLTVVLVAILLVVIYWRHRRQPLTALDLIFYALVIAFSMVFLMPKMHERFLLLPLCLMVINASIQKNTTATILAVAEVVILSAVMLTWLFVDFNSPGNVISDPWLVALFVVVPLLGAITNCVVAIVLGEQFVTRGRTYKVTNS